MPTQAIVCLNCGKAGEIEVKGLNDGGSPSGIFRHQGHNPFSGHMHFQCPACGITLLIDPTDVLSDGMAPLYSLWTPPKPVKKKRAGETSPRGSLFQRFFH